ncbi:hypothetical protein DERF_000251, partial [Dermatophagoides farinae]
IACLTSFLLPKQKNKQQTKRLKGKSIKFFFFGHKPTNQPNKKPTNQIIKTLATKAVSRSDCHTIFINRIITNSSLNLSGYLT